MEERLDDKKRKSIEIEPSRPGQGTRGSKAGRNGELATSAAESINITAAAAHLNSLLEAKEKELKDREAHFTRRVNVFESQNPSLGSDDDVIQLNVGGTTDISVLRRTLTLFEDSMLAAQFSGRWDDSMAKDRDGNMFVDQDPENFLCLIKFLRMKMNNRTRQVARRHLPNPSYSFCSMLEYYNLMPGVYPQKWIGESSDKFTYEETSYGTVVLSTQKADNQPVWASLLHDFGAFTCGVSEFTVQFEKGTSGSAGWLHCMDYEENSKVQNDTNQPVADSLFLNITERKIFGPSVEEAGARRREGEGPTQASVLQENIMIDHVESATKITCRHSGKAEYSVELIGASPSCGATSTLLRPYSRPNRIFPMIVFSGKVTVSSFRYAIDEL